VPVPKETSGNNSYNNSTKSYESPANALHSRQRPPPRSPILATGEESPHASPSARRPPPAAAYNNQRANHTIEPSHHQPQPPTPAATLINPRHR